MIIGMATTSDISSDIVKKALENTWHFQTITESELIKTLGVGNLVNNSNMKIRVMDNLSTTYDHVLISSNVFLDADVCQHIIDNNGLLLVVVDDSSEEHLKSGFIHKWMHHSTFKKCIWTYNALKCSLDRSVQDTFIQMDDHFKELKIGQVRNVTNEETIRKAMQKLGLDVDNIPQETTSEKPKSEGTDSDTKIESVDTVETSSKTSTSISSDVSKDQSELSSLDVYIKLRDGTFALLIPADKLSQLPQSEIEGHQMLQLTFKAPDLGNTHLQQLPILNLAPNTNNEESSKLTSKMQENSTEPKELLELVQEKAKVDQAIKDARANGDEVKIKELRKQRHALRDKINKFGQ